MTALARKGFTLIEVLIAAALFAIAATSLIGVVVNTLTALQAHETRSTREADQSFVLDQLNAIETKEELEQGGRIELPQDRSVEWSAEYEAADFVDLHQITYTLTWNREDDTEITELSVYRLATWLSEAAEREAQLADKRRELESLQ